MIKILTDNINFAIYDANGSFNLTNSWMIVEHIIDVNELCMMGPHACYRWIIYPLDTGIQLTGLQCGHWSKVNYIGVV